eukprot:Skav206595  [mRNA]  locus=scaffold4512:66441:68692:+ [translate_table: standard]
MGFTSFGLNEFFRRSLEKWSGDPFGEAGAIIVLVASISSVFVSGILAVPFETLRVRVMAPTEKRSFGDVAMEAVQKLSELWAGLVPFWAREIPFSACKFLVFDLASRAILRSLTNLHSQAIFRQSEVDYLPFSQQLVLMARDPSESLHWWKPE